MRDKDQLSKKESSEGLIFILGVTPRSGTNFLNNLLLLHPDCGYPGIVWEDFFLAHADLLVQYTERVKSHWTEKWRQRVGEYISPVAPLNFIGRGLQEFMRVQQQTILRHPELQIELSGDGKYLVSATPSVKNLELFFDLFEDSRMLIITRDGRAVVESGVRSFGWDYEGAMRMWATASNRIMYMDSNTKVKDRYMIVRYEDLFVETEKTLFQILDFLKLDLGKYDFTAALNLGVCGSSELRHEGKALHWKSIDKQKGFNPLSRADKWNDRLCERFNWIASDCLGYFAYDQQQKSSKRRYWHIWNSFMDAIYSIELKATGRINGLARIIRWIRLRMMGLSTRK